MIPASSSQWWDVHGPIRTKLAGAWPYSLLFATGGGSRAYGCAGMESDYDIQGVHLLPLDHVLGTNPDAFDTMRRKYGITEEHPELEVSTHDLKKFLKLLAKGNGNVLECLYSPMVIVTSPFHDELKALAQGCITKSSGMHYRGHAKHQQRTLATNEVKKLLHTYRCLLMGIYLMQTGRIEMHLPTLAQLFKYPQVNQLITRKVFPYADHGPITEEVRRHHMATLYALDLQLEHAMYVSTLPDETHDETMHALEQFLIDTRKKGI